MKTAFVTGITGQDGSYLAEFLLAKGYRVVGLVRRASTFNTSRIDHLIQKYPDSKFSWRRGDLTDEGSLSRVLLEVRPDEVYNLAAQSHVMVGFEIPEYTLDVAALGTLRLLETMRNLGLEARVYQASSSEMFGSSPPPQNENTPFRPESAYAIGKVAAFSLCRLYREGYGMWVANGILFNHESPRRGETFVTRKVTRAVARIALGIEKRILLGNLESRRDWGYAPEYCQLMWRMVQERKPDDYVVATGESHSVEEFVVEAFGQIGVSLAWSGKGRERFARVERISQSAQKNKMKISPGQKVVSCAPEYFRPADPATLLGDSRKARKKLGWNPKVKFKDLVNIMVAADIKQARMLLEGTKRHNEPWREFIV